MAVHEHQRVSHVSNPLPPPVQTSGNDQEEGMVRMSFLEHLQELRTRIFKALGGVAAGFLLSLTFSGPLWDLARQPSAQALRTLGYEPELVMIDPMEGVNIIWWKLPLVCSLFVGSPWVLYQVWAFISPGLYRHERRWAAPLVACSAGLFILGGAFAYFVVFRQGLTFLLGIGHGRGIRPVVSVEYYFDLFVDVLLGVGVTFEVPVLIFLLTALGIVTPGFLLRNSRYAVLAIVTIAAVVTPTADSMNLMLFATPMCMLFYGGAFASYLLVLRREGRTYPWRTVVKVGICILLATAAGLYVSVTRYNYKLVSHWPFLVR